ncbi:SPOR domain-containing protein [Arenibacterium sp. CAU 1754]
MSEAQNVNRPAKRLAGLILATATLSACAEGETFSFLQPKDNPAITEDEATASTRAPTKLIERDVEAPDVFSATEAGLWDGRPSLGGVWVAHPDVDEPERVMIRNTANGKSVIGALFRRERDIPGPRIQASSDAATALGMLAGAPVQLSVIALRREEVTEEPETPAPETVETVPETTEVAESTLDPIAGAEAAIDAAGAQTASVGEAAVAEEPIITEPAPKKTWFGQKLFGRKKVDDAPLDAIGATTVVATDIAATELPAATAAAPTAAPVAAPAPAPAPKPKPKKSSLDKPFIQIGIFSVESNANRTADQIRRSGIVPTVYEQSSNGKKFWRVVVGPAQSKSERATLLKKVKNTGFSDAYAVTN